MSGNFYHETYEIFPGRSLLYYYCWLRIVSWIAFAKKSANNENQVTIPVNYEYSDHNQYTVKENVYTRAGTRYILLLVFEQS